MRKNLLIAALALLVSVGGMGAAQAARGEDNSCPPRSPAFPNPEPPSCGKRPAPTPPPPPPPPAVCAGTLAEDVFNGTRDIPVASDVIVSPDGAGPVSTPVDETVTGIAGAELGEQAGCAVSLTGL